MKIGIIGPNKIFEENLKEREKLSNRVAKIIAMSGNEIVLTPDKNSLLEYFGKRYVEYHGKRILLIIPTKDKDYKKYLNIDIGEIVSCIDWDRQADEFNRQSDLFICLGYSWGAMKEIACAQYFNKKKIYVLKEFISEELPKELNFLVEYISINEIKRKLGEIREKSNLKL